MFHRCGGESRKSDNVTGGVNIRHRRLKKLVDLQSSSRIRLKAGRGQVEKIRIALAPHSIEKSITMKGLAALQPRGDSISVLINFYGNDLFSKPKDDFEL